MNCFFHHRAWCIRIWVITRRTWTRPQLIAFGFCLFLFLGVPWVSSIYTRVSISGRFRDLLPATAAGVIVLGVAVSQINRALLQYRISFSTLLTIVPLTIVIVVPNLASDIDIVKIRMREDSRVVMRTWADNSLEPDAFLVTKENHKTFNPFFGGIEGKKWFNWWYTDNLLDHPIDVWHRQFDIGYVAIPLKQLQEMKQSRQGQDCLAPLLHLRNIVSPHPIVDRRCLYIASGGCKYKQIINLGTQFNWLATIAVAM
jgi:hypothetical protein